MELQAQSETSIENDVSVYSESDCDSDDQDTVMTKEKQEEIAKGENKAVFWSRVIGLSVLVLTAVGVALAVYFYLTAAEEEEFENKFSSDASKVFESVGKSLDQTLGATDAFVVKMIAYARYSNSTWPFVTMPGFGIQATKLLRLSRAFHVGISHIVVPEERDEWQRYANETHGWIDESVEIQANDEDWHGPIVREYNTSYEIFGFAGPVPEPAPYMPNYIASWQQAPMVPNSGAGFPYNWDGWQIPDVAAAILSAFETQRVVINNFGNIVDDPNDPISVLTAEAARAWSSSYISPDDDSTEPLGVISYPVIDSMESVRIDVDEKQPIVAVLTFAIFWRELIRDIFPLNSDGVLVVFEHACGQAFTYQLDGPATTFVGVGDLHDPKYDYLGQLSTFHNLMDTSESSYTGIPLSDEYCPKTLKVYPTQAMEDDHVTSAPVLFTVIAALIFAFTSAIFLAYDFLVARRQRIVMDRAIASGDIVSSLFPEKVRRQMYKEKTDQQEKEFNAKNFVSNGGEGKKGSRPIADLFEETTVLFADLAGFTAWSAKRTPTEVFELLETLYGAFDAIAKRRGVFKIETIGDCYVAVTGIPEPQRNHAVIMCRFAYDCMVKLNQITIELVETLGGDTADLEMRVGLHSGSTTAGVLRGEKARFQLFGDTVNTASRMESNGVRGHIHVSQSTADALIAGGKGSWLTARQDAVFVKGLGEMQTYFVEVKAGVEKSSMSRSTDGMSFQH